MRWLVYGFCIFLTVLFGIGLAFAAAAGKAYDLVAGALLTAFFLAIAGVVVWAFFSFFGAVQELVRPR